MSNFTILIPRQIFKDFYHHLAQEVHAPFLYVSGYIEQISTRNKPAIAVCLRMDKFRISIKFTFYTSILHVHFIRSRPWVFLEIHAIIVYLELCEPFLANWILKIFPLDYFPLTTWYVNERTAQHVTTSV